MLGLQTVKSKVLQNKVHFAARKKHRNQIPTGEACLQRFIKVPREHAFS